MKKLALILAIVLCLGSVALAEAPVDAMTSASVADFYAATALTGDELMNTVNSFSGAYLVATVNEDGTPNCAYFIYSIVKLEDKYYVQLGLAPNQSRDNLLRTGKAVAVYAAAPSGEEGAKPYSVAGARMKLDMVTDEATFKALNTNNSETVIFMEIVETRPLG